MLPSVHSFKWVFACLGIATFLLSSCRTKRFLNEGEYFVKENTVVLKNSNLSKQDKRALNVGSLAGKSIQQPNTNWFFFLPREWVYFKLKKEKKSSFLNRQKKNLRLMAAPIIASAIKQSSFEDWLLRNIAEEPILFSDSLMRISADRMVVDLQNKGFFDATVFPQAKLKRKNASIRYEVQPGVRYTVDSFIIITEDTLLEKKISAIRERTVLTKGKPVSADLYELEKTRITDYLRNTGYANFYVNYITPLQGDSIGQKVNVQMEILRPERQENHLPVTIGNIHVFQDVGPFTSEVMQEVRGVFFHTFDSTFTLRPEIVLDRIFIRTGQLFSQRSVDKTSESLNTLDIFRFVTLRQQVDSLDAQKVHFIIQLTSNKKFEVSGDISVSNTTRRALTSPNLLGTYFSPTLTSRNPLGEGTIVRLNGRFGLEFGFLNNQQQGINTVDVLGQLDVSFPNYSDYFNLARGLRKTTLLPDKAYQHFKYRARSKFSGSYNFSKILNYYSLKNYSISYGFDYQISSNRRLTANNLGIEIVIPNRDFLFDSIALRNPFLDRTIQNQFFTGFVIRNFSFLYNKERFKKIIWTVQLDVDLSGAEFYGLNSLYNAIASKDILFKVNNIELSKYGRIEWRSRREQLINDRQSIAFRFNGGVALPYGDTKDIPYTKLFNIGGAQSIRAWLNRGLGPGSYLDSLTLQSNNSAIFYQAADMKLETSLEYRFFIMDFGVRWEGAIFLDAGNIWTLKPDAQRPGAEFTFRDSYDGDGNLVNEAFYKEIAVGTGMGLRFDANYFLIGFDFGFPLRTPYKPADFGRWRPVSTYQIRDFNLNLSLGYPF